MTPLAGRPWGKPWHMTPSIPTTHTGCSHVLHSASSPALALWWPPRGQPTGLPGSGGCVCAVVPGCDPAAPTPWVECDRL